MSSALRLSLVVQAYDYACKPRPAGESIRDANETLHDLIDLSPVKIDTYGSPGGVFQRVLHNVAQIERLVVDFGPGTDAWMRLGGAEALFLGGNTSPVFAGGETLVLAIDGTSPFTVTFLSSDVDLGLVVRRINYAAGAAIASLIAGRLALQGVKTGGAAAALQDSLPFGCVQVVSGTALAQLGLTAGVVYGQGRDVRVGPGMYVRSFPPGALPSRIELSGHVPSAKFTIAGKAA